MLKIDYPNSGDLKLFKDDFYKKVSYLLDINSIRLILKKTSYTLEQILTSSLSELIELYKNIELKLSPTEFSILESYFNYDGTSQPVIANFFSTQDELKLESCYYCNMGYIHSFKDFGDYKDGKDFLNRGHDYELFHVPYITPNKLTKMRSKGHFNRPFTDIDSVLISKTSKKWLKNYSPTNNKNHFTLDHVLPKKKYQLISLSLFNFVPCCFACNSKFKRAKEFDPISNTLTASPSSETFSIDTDFEFYLEYEGELKDLKDDSSIKLAERILTNKKVVNDYFWMFKIPGRYFIHKKEALRLIRLRNNYPDSKIKEIMKLTNSSETQIMKDIFGDELFGDELKSKPIVKFKRDISKNLKIKGVL